MTDWTAFAGFTGVVLALLLALVRLSAPTVGDATGGPDDGTAAADAARPPPSSGVDRPRGGPGDANDADGTRAASDRRRPGRGRGTPDLPPGALLANVALSQGLFASLLAGVAWWTAVPADALGFAPPVTPRLLALGVGLGLLLWVGNEFAGRLGARMGVEGGEEFRAALAPESARGWAVLLLCVLPLVALFEEFLFRAAFVGALAAGFGLPPWPLAALSSVAFALGHGAQGRAGVAVTGVLGFALAAGFVLTGSFLVVAVAHYLVNALEFLVHERPGAGGE